MAHYSSGDLEKELLVGGSSSLLFGISIHWTSSVAAGSN